MHSGLWGLRKIEIRRPLRSFKGRVRINTAGRIIRILTGFFGISLFSIRTVCPIINGVVMLPLRISVHLLPLFLFVLNNTYAITPPPGADNYLDINGGANGTPGYICDHIGWRPSEDVYLLGGSGANRHLCGDTSVRSFNFNYKYPSGWTYHLDENIIYMGSGGFIIGGDSGMKLDGGSLTSLSETLRISFRDHSDSYGVLELDTNIRDNGNIKVGIDISKGGEGNVYLRPRRSNTFSGDVSIRGNKALILESLNGSISISGNMNVKSGARIESRKSGQVAKYVHVTLESRGSEPVSQLILKNGVQESFHKLTIDGRGVLEFKGSSKLILDDLIVGIWDILTVVGWEHNKDLFLVHKTSTHIKKSLDNIIFQGQSGRVHLEDYNKDYWELTTAPEPTTTGAIIGAIIAGISIRRNRLEKTKEVAIR